MISREEAITVLTKSMVATEELLNSLPPRARGKSSLNDKVESLKFAIEALSQPERPKGRWVPTHEHMWRKYDGEIDTDAWECGYHNGPVCELCGKHICVNCNPDWAKDECDIESYRCSECNHHAKEKTGFCPNCGADMRGEEE